VARGVWALWSDVPEPTRTELRAIYRDLRTRYGPFTRLARRWAVLAAETWYVTGQASADATAIAAARRTGRGRRPDVKAVRQAAKRQALQLSTLDTDALRRLEALAGKNGHGSGSPAEDLMEQLKHAPILSPSSAADGESC
jgi:hypothetical protein